jgi:hypothetical protein
MKLLIEDSLLLTKGPKEEVNVLRLSFILFPQSILCTSTGCSEQQKDTSLNINAAKDAHALILCNLPSFRYCTFLPSSTRIYVNILKQFMSNK